MIIHCPQCGRDADKATRAVNRAAAQGARVYCGRKCAALGRRKNRTKAERVEAKRLYDAEYRAKNLEMLKEKKRAYFQRTYDPEKAREYRKKIMPRHVEYCRQPEYRQKKQQYDRQRNAEVFGPFAEAWLVLRDLEREISSRMSRYDIYIANGTINKRLKRKREHESLVNGSIRR